MKQIENEELAKYTNYKIGGKTPMLFIVEDKEDLKDINLDDIYILGAGSNVLINNKGIEKNVVKIEINDSFIDLNKNEVYLGAGVNLNEISFLLCKYGISTLINVFGIPGSIGGGLVMNCSASHGAISDNLISVEYFNKNTKKFNEIKKEDCVFAFRHSIFQDEKDWIIVGATFGLKFDDSIKLLESCKFIKEYRERNYPTIFGSAGCWFKRDWGGKDIIKKIDMVGKWHGGAVVSPMFPAFIINLQEATFEDIISLVEEIRTKAKDIGEDMPLEVQIWEK